MTAPVLVTWTAESLCGVCDRTGLVWFDWLDGRVSGRVSGRGVVACPHSPTDPRTAMPVLCVRWLDDKPRGGAA